MDRPWSKRRARSAPDATRTPLLLVLRTALLASLSLGSTTIAAQSAIAANARKLEGSHRGRVASHQPRLRGVGTADLRGRAALRPSSLDGHPTRRDGRCARHPRVDGPAPHAGDASSPPRFGIQLLAGCRCSADSPTATPTTMASTTRSTTRARLPSTRASRVPSSDSCTRPTHSGWRPRGSSNSSTSRTAPGDQPRRPRLRQDSDRRGRLRELDRAAGSLRRCTRRVGRDSSQLDARRDRSSVEATLTSSPLAVHRVQTTVSHTSCLEIRK